MPVKDFLNLVLVCKERSPRYGSDRIHKLIWLGYTNMKKYLHDTDTKYYTRNMIFKIYVFNFPIYK